MGGPIDIEQRGWAYIAPGLLDRMDTWFAKKGSLTICRDGDELGLFNKRIIRL